MTQLERQNLILRDKVDYLEQKLKPNPKDYDAVSQEIEEEADSEQGGLEESLSIIGVIGLLISLLFSVASISGYSVYKFNSSNISTTSAVIFVVSLMILFIGRKI